MDAPFAAADAEAERLRLERTSAAHRWTDGKGRPWDLVIPPTVYPPREDTDLLADALAALGAGGGRTVFEVGVGSGALLLQMAADGWNVTGCDVHPYAVAASRHALAHHGHTSKVLEADIRDVDTSFLGPADLIIWNTPYLPPVSAEDAHLGPLEEAALSDPVPGGSALALLAVLADLPARPQRRAMVVLGAEAYSELRSEATKRGWSCTVEGRRVFDDGEGLILAGLERAWPTATHTVVASTGSTNADLMENEGAVGDSLRAVHQTKGRGRRTASWASNEGDLTASWIVHDGQGPIPAHGLVQAACALAARDVLVDLARMDVDDVLLKWPNDLLVEQHALGKVGGWLVESRQQGRNNRVVAGLGLNLTPGPSSVAGTPRGSLEGVDASDLHSALTVRLCTRLNALRSKRGRAGIVAEASDAYRNSASVLGLTDIEGNDLVPTGMDMQGGLSVEGREETIHDLDAVMWRAWPSPQSSNSASRSA